MSKADLTKMNFMPTHEKYVSVMLHKDCVLVDESVFQVESK
jgi:hypothetical protein